MEKYLSIIKESNKNILSLDISVQSTGIVSFYNGEITENVISLKKNKSLLDRVEKEYLNKLSSIYNINNVIKKITDVPDIMLDFIRLNIFKNEIIALINNKKYDYIIIEEVIGGSNFKTNKNLFQLNRAIDSLFIDGTIGNNIPKIYREVGTAWQKKLRVICETLGMDTKSLKGEKNKAKIQEYMKFLEYKIDGDEDNISNVQDIIDAYGLMVVGIEKIF